jgi:hypothetical protein
MFELEVAALSVIEREELREQEAIRDRLLVRLRAQRARTLEMLAWYQGQQDAPGLPRGADNDVHRRIRDTARNAWGRLIVDTIAERLEVQGYRSSVDGAEEAAWAVLQANRIDSDQRQVHTEALIAGVSYVLVTPSDGDEPPLITPETALEVAHEWEPGSRRRVAAAVKAFRVGATAWRCELLTPSMLYAWEAELADATVSLWADETLASVRWALDEDADVVENDLGVVPLVPFENRPLPATGPLSELNDLTNVFARIDELTLNRQISAHYGAFRQKWATGLEIPRDPTTGEPVEPFQATVKRLWISEDSETKFGSFEATELDGYTKAIDAEVAEMAAISRVPAHYLMQQNLANPPSAESLVASESGLVQKVRDRQRGYGESWEQVVRLAFLAAGDEPASRDLSSEIIWRDPQIRHPSQVADAVVKYQQAGVPDEALWEYIGFSPQQIRRFRAMRAEQQLLAPPPVDAAAGGGS